MVNNHYFELGNVQINLKKVIAPYQIKGASGGEIVAAIEAYET